MVAVGGLSGTGKSLLARALAPALAPAPGAVVIRSDVERKALFGKGETFTTTVTKAGDISYVCTVHPNMTATLKVKP